MVLIFSTSGFFQRPEDHNGALCADGFLQTLFSLKHQLLKRQLCHGETTDDESWLPECATLAVLDLDRR